jgi:phage shock protein E
MPDHRDPISCGLKKPLGVRERRGYAAAMWSRSRALAVLLALTPGCLAGNISNERAHTLVEREGAVLVDVRTSVEYATGHIDGAVNVPVGDLGASLATFPARKDQDVIVYCQSGHRSAKAAAILEKAGYTKVHDLGSIINWK